MRRQAEQLRRLEQRAHEQQLAVEKARQAEVLARTNERLDVMTRAMMKFLQHGSWSDAAGVLLDGAMDFARSTAGFVASIEPGSVRVFVQRGWDELLVDSPSKPESVAADGWALREPLARIVRAWINNCCRNGGVCEVLHLRRSPAVGQVRSSAPAGPALVADNP